MEGNLSPGGPNTQIEDFGQQRAAELERQSRQAAEGRRRKEEQARADAKAKAKARERVSPPSLLSLVILADWMISLTATNRRERNIRQRVVFNRWRNDLKGLPSTGRM